MRFAASNSEVNLGETPLARLSTSSKNQAILDPYRQMKLYFARRPN